MKGFIGWNIVFIVAVFLSLQLQSDTPYLIVGATFFILSVVGAAKYLREVRKV